MYTKHICNYELAVLSHVTILLDDVCDLNSHENVNILFLRHLMFCLSTLDITDNIIFLQELPRSISKNKMVYSSSVKNK